MISFIPVPLFLFIHENKANKGLFEIYLLFFSADELIGCFHIRHLTKPSEGVRCRLLIIDIKFPIVHTEKKL